MLLIKTGCQFLGKSETFEYLVVCLFYIAQITTETVFIQFFVGVNIPETAGIGRDFICQNNLVMITAKLNFEVDEFDVCLQKILF